MPCCKKSSKRISINLNNKGSCGKKVGKSRQFKSRNNMEPILILIEQDFVLKFTTFVPIIKGNVDHLLKLVLTTDFQ
jgi:hypothetical protein